MPNYAPAFSVSEYQRRLSLVRSQMAADGVDVLFVTNPSNMAWLTGYDGWSFYVHQGVIIQLEADPMWWGRHMDSFGAHRTCWIPDERVLSYSDDWVQSDERHAMQHLAAILADLGYGGARIGVEMENYYFTAAAMDALRGALPDAAWVDSTNLVNWQRTVKSDEELAFMRKAAAISTKMIDGIMERVAVGLPKNELVADIYRDALIGVEGAWGDYPAIVPLLPSGPDAAAAHLTWDGRPFQANEATFFEISGCYRRYHAPLCRTVYLGDPPSEMRHAEAAVQRGIEAALDAARPGNRACDIAVALKAELAKAGIDRQGRVGYAVGLSYPPDWGEHTVSLREADLTPLRAGMSFHLMPALWMKDWGLEITETIVIREEGPAECLADVPRTLVAK